MQQNPPLKQGIETSNARASESPPSQGRTGARGDPPIQFGEQRQTQRRNDMDLKTFGQSMAHVDLSTGTVESRPAPPDWIRKYIGARGLGVRYVLEAGPEVEPLSSENLLCFINGPLTGSETSMSGRWACVTKSPLTGTVTDSHQGGWTGARLRWAGFDGIILSGKSDKPVYLFIEDGRIEIRDASDLWGKGIHETIALFKERYGKKNLSVNAIGPAGETLCRYAAWVNEDDRAFGRGGTGAVGGAKNLKAIVIRAGVQKSRDVDKDAWKQVRREALDAIRDEKNITSPRKGGLSVYGTNVLMNTTNTIGVRKRSRLNPDPGRDCAWRASSTNPRGRSAPTATMMTSRPSPR